MVKWRNDGLWLERTTKVGLVGHWQKECCTHDSTSNSARDAREIHFDRGLEYRYVRSARAHSS